MDLVDTHCHIHEALDSMHLSTETRARYKKAGMPKPDEIIKRALQDGVTKMICVGTTLQDSQLAVEFVQTRPHCWASIGIHPHEAKDHLDKLHEFGEILSLNVRPGVAPRGAAPAPGRSYEHEGGANAATGPQHQDQRQGVLSAHPSPTVLTSLRAAGVPQGPPPPGKPKIVAVGECGLDYYYTHSAKDQQEKILRFQIELAQEHKLPMIFHVRDAFDDFWRIFDEYKDIRGVIHSFSAGQKELDQILARNLYVGLNGIMTFTKNQAQLDAAKAVPLGKLLLETDAPFLTPYPHRGTICEPKHIRVIAEFLAKLRDESVENIAQATTKNAHEFFGL